jgi:AcrR family transcriptional regulator
MTKDDVISAAFRVWGQELYKTTSLAKLAETLGVSKPALYRHFPDKQALLEAMDERFYDDYAAAIKPAVEGALKNNGWQERLLSMVQFISGYFARHFDYFIYSLIRLHGSKEHRFFSAEPLYKRGVSFKELRLNISTDQPSTLFLAGLTALFGTGMFHKHRLGVKDGAVPKRLEESWFGESSEEDIRRFTGAVAERVQRGLWFDSTLVKALPYEELERRDTVILAPPDPLLKAVAEAVAEEGPWNASMETVAKRSGLSKSGLYAHFKSKEDMLSRLFMTEFDRIARCTTAHTAGTKTREEGLYLAILSIAGYLRARPEILVVLDWVRIQRLDLDLSAPEELFEFFAGLTIGVQFEKENVSHWILFLLVAVLMHTRPASGGDLQSTSGEGGEIEYGALRRLFRFISLGVEGLE